MPNMSLIRIHFIKMHSLLGKYYSFVKTQTVSTTEYYFKAISYFKNSILCSSKQDYLFIGGFYGQLETKCLVNRIL